jgi:hypothetical protein
MPAHPYRTAEEWRLDPWTSPTPGQIRPTSDEGDIAMPGGSREVGANLRKMSFEELIDGYLSGRPGFSREIIIAILRDNFIQDAGYDPQRALETAERFVSKRELERDQGLTQNVTATTDPQTQLGDQGISTQFGTPGPTPLTSERTREETFIDAEARPERVFSRFLSRPEFQGFSGLGRQALGRQLGPAKASFSTSSRIGDSFRDFLSSGAQIVGPREIVRRMGEIGNLFGQELGLEQGLEGELRDRFRPNQDAFDTFMDSFLSRVNPIFRRSTFNAAQDIFNRFEDATPESPFIKQIPKVFAGFLGPNMGLEKFGREP